MFERFDQDALKAILASQEAARDLDDGQIGTAHLLVGLVGEDWFASAQILVRLGISSSQIRHAMGLPVPSGYGRKLGPHVPFDPSMKRTVKLSLKEAKQLRSDHVGTEHLLLGLLRPGRSEGGRILGDRGSPTTMR